MGIVYFEGRFAPEDDAKVPISDRGFQFGDGAFATIQVRHGIPLFLDTHLQQLEKQCQCLNLKASFVKRETIETLISLNDAFEGIWRLKVVVSGGDSPESRLVQREGRVMAFLKPFTPLPFKPLKLGIFPIPTSTAHASFKSLAHLNRFYIAEEAHRLGMDDCVTTTEKGWLLEASFGNLFWVNGKTVLTPDPSLPLYCGVTIKNILKLAGHLGFTVEYVKRTLTELPIESVAFRTNTMQGVRPIAQIGDRVFAQNETLQALFINGYEKMIEEEKQAPNPALA